MVRVLLGLHLALTKATLRRNVWRLVGMIVGLLYALGLAATVVAGLIALRIFEPTLLAPITTLGFGALTLLWLLGSLLVFGVDQTLDPGRFALMGVRARQIMPGLFLAGFLGAGGVMIVIVSLGFVAAWTVAPLPVVAAVVAALLGIATMFLSARVATSAFTAFLASRRFRDVAVIFLALVGMFISLGIQVFTKGTRDLTPEGWGALLSTSATVTGWTPFGWAWAIPGDIQAGQWALAGLRLVLAAGLVVGLWRAWQHFLDKAMCSPLESGGDGGKVKAKSWVDRFYPATPAGGIAARSLRYWRRDPRHLMIIGILILMPILVFAPMMLNGRGAVDPAIVLFSPAIMAAFASTAMSNELSYDGSALWTHIIAGISGRDDRIGRAMALCTFLVPLVFATLLGILVVTGSWQYAPAALAATVCMLLTGIGAGAYVGAMWNVPTPPAGSSPFNKGSGGGGVASLINLSITGLIQMLPALPVIGLAIASYWMPWLGWIALLAAIAIGGAVAWFGIVKGGAQLDRRWPEALKDVTFEE